MSKLFYNEEVIEKSRYLLKLIKRESGLQTLTDKDGEKLAEWYISDTRENFIVNFYTSDLVKCRQIITMIVGQLKNLESEDK